MTRETFERATQQQIGDKGEQNCDHRRLDRIECLKHHPLVEGVHHNAKNDDPRSRNDSFPKASAASSRVVDTMKQPPEVRRASDARVMDTVARRGDDRHPRLQNETERHRTARPVKNISPQTAETL